MSQPDGCILTGTGEKRLLIVEDDILVARMYGELFSAKPWKTVVCRDAESAMTLIRSCLDFYVTVTDMRLPGPMDGLALARWLREVKPLMPLIGISGYWDMYSVAECSAMFSDIIGKGTLETASHLLEAVDDAMRRARRWRSF